MRKRERRHRIHWQMTFHVGCVVFGLFLLFTFADYVQQNKHLMDSRAAYMGQELRLLAAAIQTKGVPEKRNRFIQDYCATMQFHGRPGHALLVVDPSGQSYSTGGIADADSVMESKRVRRLLRSRKNSAQWMGRSGSAEVLVAAHTYRLPGAPGQGLVYYSESLEDIRELSRTLIVQRVVMLVLLFIGVALVIGIFVKYKIAAPLNALLLREWAAGMGDLKPRPFRDPHNEISSICTMFNYMLGKIEEREGEAQGDEQVGEAPATETPRSQGERPEAGEKNPSADIHVDELAEDDE